MRYKVVIKYDGTNYYGFQKQKDKITIQSELERVLSKIFNESINITGCSRTDKKVHANYFVFHFDSDKEKNTSKLMISMNKLLPEDIYVKDVNVVGNLFHARYSVVSKKYMYVINMEEFDPVTRNIILQYGKKIDINLLKEASKYLIGKHDFKSFTSDNEKESTIRTINYINFEIDKNLCKIYISGDGFLKYMVRNIVGLFLEINDGIKSVNDVNKVLESKDRTKLGKKALPNGLYLEEVIYDE